MRESIPKGYILLKATTDGAEALALTGLLKAKGVAASFISEDDIADIVGMNEAVPLYKVIVERERLADAQGLLQSSQEIACPEWNSYKKREMNKGKILGRAVGIFAALVFYALSMLPMKESYHSMRIVLIVLGSFFLIITLEPISKLFKQDTYGG